MGLFDHLFKTRSDGTIERIIEAPLKSSRPIKSDAGDDAGAPDPESTESIFLQPKGYAPGATDPAIGGQKQGFMPVLPGARKHPAPERRRSARETPGNIGSEIILTLGDVLPRIPAALLRAGAHDPKRTLKFHVTDLTSDITRGRPAVALSRIAEQCPDLFQKPVGDAEDMEIRLPLQKLVEQIGNLRGRPAVPLAPRAPSAVARSQPIPSPAPVVRQLPAIIPAITPPALESPVPEPPQIARPAPPVIVPPAAFIPPAPPPLFLETPPPEPEPQAPLVPAAPPAAAAEPPPAPAIEDPRLPTAAAPEPIAEPIAEPITEPVAASVATAMTVATETPLPEIAIPVSPAPPEPAPPEPVVRDEPAAEAKPSEPAPAPESVNAENEINLSLAAIVARVPAEMLAAGRPPIDENHRISLPFPLIERQLGTGAVAVSATIFWAALPPLLKHHFVFREECSVPVPLEEIFQNLPGASSPKPRFAPAAPIAPAPEKPVVRETPAAHEDTTAPLNFDATPPAAAPVLSEAPPLENATAASAPEPAEPSAISAAPTEEHALQLSPFRVFTPEVHAVESAAAIVPAIVKPIVLGGVPDPDALRTELHLHKPAAPASEPVQAQSQGAEPASAPPEMPAPGPPLAKETEEESAPRFAVLPTPTAPASEPVEEPVLTFSADQPPPLRVEIPAPAVAVLHGTASGEAESAVFATATTSVQAPPQIFRPVVLPPPIAGHAAAPPINLAPTLTASTTPSAGMISLAPAAESPSPQKSAVATIPLDLPPREIAAPPKAPEPLPAEIARPVDTAPPQISPAPSATPTARSPGAASLHRQQPAPPAARVHKSAPPEPAPNRSPRKLRARWIRPLRKFHPHLPLLHRHLLRARPHCTACSPPRPRRASLNRRPPSRLRTAQRRPASTSTRCKVSS